MAKKHLQEIYGEEEDNEIEVTDEEVGIALNEIIAELKKKHGKDWFKHIGEKTEQE